MLQDEHSGSSGLYKVWKIERRLWLEGQPAMHAHGIPEAIITTPHPSAPQRLENILASAKRASPFDDVEFSEQQFLNLGDTVIITYRVNAKHQRFRQKYRAQCTTTYVRKEGDFKVVSHTHHKIPKRA